MRPSDLFEPRGFEAYVPALAAVRAACWPRLSSDVRLLLEVADYLGLERALRLTVGELMRLHQTLPGTLWNRLDAASAGRLDDHPVFERSLETGSVAGVLQALAAACRNNVK